MGGMIARNLAKPEVGFGGWFITHALRRTNAFLETNAVRLCDIQPDHTVLEVGFGPGIGLQAAYNCIKDGNGVLHGVELSEKMLQVATASLKDEISSGKMKLIPGTVTEMPYKDSTFDRIYHTNCYYFWPDMSIAVRELHRVIKPQALMVTTLSLANLNIVDKKGFVDKKKWNPDRYMEALQKHGFHNVHFDELEDGVNGQKYQAIFATSQK